MAIISSGLWLVIILELAGEGLLRILTLDHRFIGFGLYVFVSHCRVILPGSRILISFEFILSAKLHSIGNFRSKWLCIVNGSRTNIGSLTDTFFLSLLSEGFLGIVSRFI